MSVGPGKKRCFVAYATRERQYLWPVELAQGASVEAALAAAREGAPQVEVPWEKAEVGIFGEPCARGHVPADGDRIEIYRPLARDPRQARRDRIRGLKGRGK
jgi:uncharacterized protein